MSDEKAKSNELAKGRVQRALDKIETAQGLIGEACGDLSRVVGAAPEWRKAGKLYDDVKATWHRINNSTAGKLDKIRMDG